MPTILVAEEHGPLRTFLGSVLTAAGYEVIEACDAGQALNLSMECNGCVDLLCAHVAMDGNKGSVLARRLRHQFPGMKVLLLVTENPRYVVVETADLECESGCSVLRKPFTIEQLLNAVEQTLKPPAAVPGASISS